MTTFDPSHDDQPGSALDEQASGLDGDVAALLSRERRSHPQDAARKARVLAKLEAILPLDPRGPDGGGGAPAPAPSIPASASVSRKLLTVSVAACLAGASGAVWTFASRSEPVASVAMTPEPMPRPSPTTSSGSAPSPVTPEVPETISAEALPSAPIVRAAEHAKKEEACTICEERAILEAARRGLREGRYESALERIGAHERRYRRGQLSEERESLRIHVLVATGRTNEAERRAAEFESAFPESPLLGSVRRATSR